MGGYSLEPVTEACSKWNLLSQLLQVYSSRKLAQVLRIQEWPDGCRRVTVPYDENWLRIVVHQMLTMSKKEGKCTGKEPVCWGWSAWCWS